MDVAVQDVVHAVRVAILDLVDGPDRDAGLFERLQAFRIDQAGQAAAMRLAYAELMSAGVTSVVDLSQPPAAERGASGTARGASARP